MSDGNDGGSISIFDEQVARKPDRYPWAKDFIRAMWHNPWNPDEFNFKSDIHDYHAVLTDQEKVVVRNTLSAIAQIEVAVKTFWSKLGDNLPHPSLRDLGCVMGYVEVVHNHAYEKLLVSLGLEDAFEANLTLPVIKGRVEYLRKYTNRLYGDRKKQYIYALILFTLYVENVSLFSQFYVIDWLNRNRNVLKDTSQQTKYTRNEETIHALVGIRLVNAIRSEHPELFDQELIDRILHEAEQSIEAETRIIEWMLGDYRGDGLSPEILGNFIRDRMNTSLSQIGMPARFPVDHTLLAKSRWFDEEVLGNNSTDFFHKRPVEYTKNNRTFTPDDIF